MRDALTIITTADHSPVIMQRFAEMLSKIASGTPTVLTWLVIDGLHAYQSAPALIANNTSVISKWIKPETPLPQLAAIMLGITYAQGAILIMDPDMAENLSDIPRFQAAHDAGAKIVFGRRIKRIGLSGSRLLLTTLFNGLVRRVLRLPLHDFNTPMVSLSEKGLECLLGCPSDCPSPRLYACHQLKAHLREVHITTHEATKKSSYTMYSRLKTGMERLYEIVIFLIYLRRTTKNQYFLEKRK